MVLLRGLANNDTEGQIKRVIAFVRKHVVYVKDPDNTEYVVSPLRMLNQIQSSGYTMGDCDDHVMLLNTMLGSIGVKSRFTGVKFQGNKFNHVISTVLCDGRFIQVDPCAKSGNLRTYAETQMI